MNTEKNYRNLFAEAGYSEEAITRKMEDSFYEIFYGEDRFFHFVEGDDTMAYMEDTGNHDARTEGMSYGMMMCVQMDKKKEFDALWKWAKTYMFMEDGVNAGYYAWSVATNGEKNAYGPAPDGEEFFAMDLILASKRWGDGEGIYAYSREAKILLSTIIHKGEDGVGRAMWDASNHLIRFIAECDFSDPSYHLPHFYEVFAEHCNPEDKEFWLTAAKASRDFLKLACNENTGMSAEYSYFDGTPYEKDQEIFGRHDWFYSDAYRTMANIALDASWNQKELEEEYVAWCSQIAAAMQRFFAGKSEEERNTVYTVEGEPQEEKVLHPIGLLATIAEASLVSADASAMQWVKEFWNTPMRKGDRRYYDNCLYFFAVLALSGRYRA